MRVWLLLTMTALVVATAVVTVACGGDDGTPQAPTPMLGEGEAWAIVVDKAITACPGYAAHFAQYEYVGRHQTGSWMFWDTSHTIQFRVYEASRTVTGNAVALTILAGSNRGCH